MTNEDDFVGFNQSDTTDIGLNELILSWHFLSPTTDDAKKAIANTLGFDLQWRDVASVVSSSPNDSQANTELGIEPVSNIPSEKIEEFPEIENTETADLSPNAIRLKPQQEKETNFVEIFKADWDKVESLSPTRLELHFEKPPFVPLFDEKWFRAIMSLILATSTFTREIDLNFVEEKLINLSVIEKVPMLYRKTLSHGVQVMLDVSDTMQPYSRDQKEILSSLFSIFDEHQIKVLRFGFEILPQRRILWHDKPVKNIQSGIPILMITNFFTSNRQKLWRIGNYEPLMQFFREAKNKKCPVAALIPLPKTEFPVDLKQFISYSYVWDRTTTPQVASKIKRN